MTSPENLTKKSRKESRNTFRQIYLWPIAILLVVGFGLFAALLGDGIWDAASWGALLVPVIAVAVGWWKQVA